MDATKILSRSEIVAVLADLKRKRRSVNTRQNLVVFRLATCCGLRVSEICGLKLANVKLGGDRPHIEVPKAIAKRRKSRRVPLWWDAATLADLQAWREERVHQGGSPGDLFACSQSQSTLGRPLTRQNAAKRFKHCIKCLGQDRVSQLSIHSGRHSFCSHAIAGGRTLVEVRDAAGHANISTTSIYAHVAHDDGTVGNLFEFGFQFDR